MFPVKHTVIYTFFAITSVQNTCFCSVFNALASKNPAKSCYVQCFFHFWPFFHCRKATKMTQNSISIPSCAQTPKNPRKMSKTPPYSGLGAKRFLPPPAKADIATAILTNVIEHLVLLLPPNKHAFTAKAVWADFQHFSTYFNTLQQFDTVQELSNARTGRTAWPTGLCGDNETYAVNSIVHLTLFSAVRVPNISTCSAQSGDFKRHWPSLAVTGFHRLCLFCLFSLHSKLLCMSSSLSVFTTLSAKLCCHHKLHFPHHLT